MRSFTQHRQDNTADELWLCQHPAVFTQGQAGKAEHIADLGHIPLVQTDRGGQVTYHGPGQLVIYPLIQLNRHRLGVKQFVHLLETIGIDFLAQQHIIATRQEKQPGLYIQGKKIASLGLKIHRGCSYHGMAINIHMDLTPFQRITPCGLHGMQMTQWSHFQTVPEWHILCQQFIDTFTQHFYYSSITLEAQEQPWHCPISP